MKQTFPGYYRPTGQELQTIWETCVFVPDANVLLNLYGYSARTRKKLVALFESIAERTWMPHQFAAEYQRNRVKAIADQVQSYRTIKTQLQAVLNDHLKPAHRHPFVGRKSMNALEKICGELDKGKRLHEAMLTDDPLFGKLTAVLANRVGPKPTSAELNSLYEQGKARYDAKIPPGFADKKPEPDRYGDYIGWQQILTYGATINRPLLLITDDRKEDWWHLHTVGNEGKERRIGPRPELIAEYMNACTQPFYMYTLELFIERAQEFLGSDVGTAALQEVKERSSAQQGQRMLEAATSEIKPSELRIEVSDFEAKAPPVSEDEHESDSVAKPEA